MTSTLAYPPMENDTPVPGMRIDFGRMPSSTSFGGWCDVSAGSWACSELMPAPRSAAVASKRRCMETPWIGDRR